MTGFNLPPGVSISDIPGNRPEDLAADEFWMKLGELHPDLPESIWEDEAVQKLVESARDLAWSAGYEEGRADEQLAEAARQSESVDPQVGGSEATDPQEARLFVQQCFRMRHVHPRWRQWLRKALKDARR